MSANLAVDQARERLGRVGVGLTPPPTSAAEWQRELARIEHLGYRSAWFNEGIGGKEIFTGLALGLAATDHLVLGTGVANIWARHPATMQASAATLAEAYPGRVALGIGVSHRFMVEASGQTWTDPLTTQREYLERMRESAVTTVQPGTPFPTIVGALGPRMTELAGTYADGAVPSNMPVAHTELTRELIGPDKLLVAGVGTIQETDLERVHAAARRSPLLEMFARSPQIRGLQRLGYTESELDGPSDRVLEDIFAWGSPADIAERVRQHLDAGADHVVLYGDFFRPLTEQVDQLETLTPEVLRAPA